MFKIETKKHKVPCLLPGMANFNAVFVKCTEKY